MSSLERVASVRQTSIASTGLPLELQQQVFSYLDTATFYSARKVCKWWNFASTAPLSLARQLRRLPILPPVQAATSTQSELQKLYDEATHTLMVDVRTERAHDTAGRMTKASQLGFQINPRIVATSNGNRTARLYGRMIELYDTTGSTPVLKYQRTLNDLKETIGNGPWLKCQPNSHNELALSSDGSMLAISQERTIQIYDLRADADSFTINEYISSASGHYICGLEFEHNDHVLRVRLSGKGTVLYLGTPPSSEKQEQRATVEHWKSKAGLKHTFLDSALLTVANAPEEVEQPARFCGVQILQPFEDGWLFAGQKQGGGESSLYVLGHVQMSTPHNTNAMRVEPGSVTVLARLESFLSAWKYMLEAGSEEDMGLWENMPSAHEHHPRFAMDPKGNFIALAERDKKRIRPAPLTQLFVYRLPTKEQLYETLSQSKPQPISQLPRVDSFLDMLEGKVSQVTPEPRTSEPESQPKHTVARIPLCLTTLQGDVMDLKCQPINEQKCLISASTAETTMTWMLEDW